MKRRIILSGVIIFLIAAAAGYWQLTPEVSRISPLPEEGKIYGFQALRVEFSRPMNPESVRGHFSLVPSIPGNLTWDESQRIFTFTPDSPWPSGTSIALTLSPGSKSRLGLPDIQSYNLEFQISPPLLIYLWPADGVSNLYTLNPVTGEGETLTSEANGVLDYDVSGDGSSIYYAVQISSQESAIYEFNRNRKSSSRVLKCVKALCRAPAISPDGQLLAYEYAPQIAGAVPQVRIYDMDEGSSRIVGDPTHYTSMPLWSSSGWLSMFDYTEKAYLFSDPTTSRSIVMDNDTDSSGSWDPGRNIFYTSEIYQPELNLAPRHILKFILSSQKTFNLTNNNRLEDAHPVPSPDGDWIAFERKSLQPQQWTPGRQLWIMDPEGRQAQALTDAPDYHHTAIAWHPDGLTLVYVRYNNAELSEAPEIWMIDRASGDKMRLVINGFAPRWLP